MIDFTRNIKIALQHLSAAMCLILLAMGQSAAAWYETQGQATLLNNNKVGAKQRATEEALRQAMLFSGASVRSVQQLSNGLLNSSNVEVYASGEVRQLELVSEKWTDDIVTIKIRADIFPTTQQCQSSSYYKTIATSYFPLLEKQHAQDGQLQEIGRVVATHLKNTFDNNAKYSTISALEPYTINWQSRKVREQASALASQTHSQYVLAGSIEDISVSRPNNHQLAFWSDNTSTRTFRMNVELIDGINGAPLFQETYETSAVWEFDRFSQIDASAQPFWQSAYGKALIDQIQQLQSDIDTTLACLPLTGRILRTHNGSQVSISLGRQHGLNIGDKLTVYQIQEIYNPRNERFLQYHLHPETVVVTEAFGNNARAEAISGQLLGNIQPGDFVTKR